MQKFLTLEELISLYGEYLTDQDVKSLQEVIDSKNENDSINKRVEK
tara:strand:+ start:1776 stop:1913 length:138 start_codon:yes stop_codon:yes gene_type:complete